MKVSERIVQLQKLPQALEVMLPCEANVDHALHVAVVQVAKTERDGSGTPVGNYWVVDAADNEAKAGKPFPAVVIAFEKPP